MEGTTTDDEDDADILLFTSTVVFFSIALWHVYQPKSLAGTQIIITNICLIKWLEDWQGISGGMLDGEVSEGDRVGQSMEILSSGTFLSIIMD
jgi:hypothetical protein